MEVIKTDIEGVYILEPRVFKDDRGGISLSLSHRKNLMIKCVPSSFAGQ